MSKYDEIRIFLDSDFRRLIGVKKKTFSKMMEVLHPIEAKRRSLGGKKPRLCLEDRLLMSLEYLREYTPNVFSPWTKLWVWREWLL